VGREREIGLLLERWQQTRQGEGQAVLLSGEPGIGKSRITQALRERIASDPQIRLRYQCSPHHATSAFHPIIEQIGRAAGFDRDDREDGPDSKLDKL
jgi:predicted ATPase